MHHPHKNDRPQRLLRLAVRSTVDLGRNLGLRVVAEGWGTRPPGRSWTRLAATRSRATTSAGPVPRDDLINWLQQQAATPDLQRQQ